MSRYSISSRSPGLAPFAYTGPVSGCATVRSSFSRSFAVEPAWICRSLASRVSSVTSSPGATSMTGAMSGCQRLWPLCGSSRSRFLRSISMPLAILFDRPDEPKTGEVVPVVGGVPVARRGAGEARHGAPGAAAGDALRAIAGQPCGAVRGGARVARIPAVLGPLPGVAEHVVEPEPVGRKAARRRGEVIAVGAFVLLAEAPGLEAALVGHVGEPAGLGGVVAPVARGNAARARRVFPFRFARQPVAPTGLFREPLRIGARIVPADAQHRVRIRLREARAAPAGDPLRPRVGGRIRVDEPGAALRARIALGFGPVAGLVGEAPEFGDRHFAAAERERPRDRHRALRPLIDAAPGFRGRR